MVAFSDIAFKYNDNENQKQNKRPNEVLTYEQIIQLPRGKQLLDEFIKNKQNKTITSKSGSKITNLGNDATKKNNQENDTVSNRTRSAKEKYIGTFLKNKSEINTFLKMLTM